VASSHSQDLLQDELSLDAFHDDVSVNKASAWKADTSTDGTFYSHGYSLRVHLLGADRDAALTALRHIEWDADSDDWRCMKLKYCTRWTVRGSTFITHRKPRNQRLPMARFNAMWKTHLYSLVVEDDGRKVALTFHGVRRHDVETILQVKMGLASSDYHIEHYTALERYFVLAPHEALRLGTALGGVASNGSGRAARKQFLLRDLPVPLVVGDRARRTARLTIYRLRGGATAQYKVELRLKGRRRDRTQFGERDVSRLDAVLAQLVSEHGLTPVAKPVRWEPVSPSPWRRDGRLAVVGQSAYRGKAVDADRIRLAEVCHTPSLCFLTGNPNGPITSVPPEDIRKSARSEAAPEAPCPRPRRSRGCLAWRSLAHDISRYDGYLSEVILDPNQDPAPVVGALIERDGQNVGVGIITDSGDGHPDVWGSVARLASAHPAVEGTQVLVVVIDFSVVLAVEAAMFVPVGDSLTKSTPGRLYPSYWQQTWGLPPWEKAVAALLAPLFAGLRDAAEATGIRIVTITTDLRPSHGRGELLRTHRFRDGRVRSHVGDAGRHAAHLRYIVDSDDKGAPTRITMAKDEGEGLPGRMIWGLS
jgi:hypothetical protein